MSEFIQNLLLINASTAVIISVFMLLRHLLKNKVHTRILCILWIAIFLRMLIPVPVESNIGLVESRNVSKIYSAVETNTSADGSSAPETTQSDQLSTYANDSTIAAASIDEQQTVSSAKPTKATKNYDIALIIYILGAAIIFAYIVISNILFDKKIKSDNKEIELTRDDIEIFKHQKIKQQKVYLSDNIQSPCISGLIKPRIMLNRKSAENETARRYSIYHETMHYKYKDNVILMLEIAACILNWFNPFMWLALSLCKKDRELLCDERVVKLIGQDNVIEYGKSLLYLSQNSKNRLVNIPTSMTGGKKEMKLRIKNLVNGPKKWIVISILVAVITVSLVFIFGVERLPKIPERSVSSMQEFYLYDGPEEYFELFDKIRDLPDAQAMIVYRKDIDQDGTDELYGRSLTKSENYNIDMVECYDLKTKTYSSIISTDEWMYRLIQYGDKLYILAIKMDNIISDESYRIYKPILANGELTYTDIESKLEQKILDYEALYTGVGISSNEGNYLALKTDNIINLSIYDISSNDLMSSYTQEDSEVMKKFYLLYTSGNKAEDKDIEHPLKAIITVDDEGEEKQLVVLFGGDEYITMDYLGQKYNRKNDGLHNYLIYLAENGNE